ncbi:MAG: hypothetical protein ACOCP8_04705 [archaeon]
MTEDSEYHKACYMIEKTPLNIIGIDFLISENAYNKIHRDTKVKKIMRKKDLYKKEKESGFGQIDAGPTYGYGLEYNLISKKKLSVDSLENIYEDIKEIKEEIGEFPYKVNLVTDLNNHYITSGKSMYSTKGEKVNSLNCNSTTLTLGRGKKTMIKRIYSKFLKDAVERRKNVNSVEELSKK